MNLIIYFVIVYDLLKYRSNIQYHLDDKIVGDIFRFNRESLN